MLGRGIISTVIPTVLLVGFIGGVLSARWWVFLGTTLAVGIAWGALVDGFTGGFALGALNAAVGFLLGAGVAAIARTFRRAGAR
jgi:hypothetical protein